MKKHLLYLFVLLPLLALAQVTTNPSPILIDQPVTLTVDLNSTDTDCNSISNPTKVYAHLGVGDDNDEYGIAVVGNWGEDDGIGEMSNNNDGTWSITFTPNTYFNLTTEQESTATKMGMVFRNAAGNQELKASGCSNFVYNIGAFQVNMINPSTNANGIVVVDNGANTQILAQNTGGPADYELFANGVSIHTQNNTTFYNGYYFSNLTENQSCELVVTQDGVSITKTFTIIVNNTTEQALPSGLKDGINYDATDATKATLVLTAPNKDFVYVVGSFNNWEATSAYAMYKNPGTDQFWLELTGLTPQQIETYQYWVGDAAPIANSPSLVKVADPYSVLVLSPFDDAYIPEASYPNRPAYPAGQNFEVTVLQTGQTAYDWQVTDFSKPNKEDLIIYEVLIRDFDADRNFQDLIDKVDYFKNLNINAIELMPIMEFEGNESWGYNTAFHMALDKFYGSQEKFKELVDVFHQNGIAVILDIAFNHAYGRNPMVRMWMNDPDGDGWGAPSLENPYFNELPTHSYSVGNDFNHSSTYTKNYVKQVVSYWIEEYKIDGFRWDLTKGFTQNCGNGSEYGDEGCTGSYQQDRVDVLKEYADHSWAVDPDHYVIFEHLGSDNEEKEWANYRLDEGKGVMMWGIMNSPYSELTMAQSGNKNINRMGHNAHTGFNGPRVVGYAESHDEERLMYKNIAYGNTSTASHNVQDLNTALSRMSALGAVSVLIPGPKMIWHFGDLGMDLSIFTCSDGSYNNDGCKLSTKPQPQWTNNWITDALRSEIYNDWSKFHALKTEEPVFEGDYSMTSGNFTPRIDIFDTSIPNSELNHVIILANFDVVSQTVPTNFPSGLTATWYDLMDATGTTTVSNSETSITIPAGQFRILGNKASNALSINEVEAMSFQLFPNPTSNAFSINVNVSQVEIYDLTGKRVKAFQGQFTQTDRFDISSLKSGVYLVKIENSNQQTLTSKLIKL